jgi:hypothetical protein
MVAGAIFGIRTMESATSGKSQSLAVAALFAFCVGPTFISYQRYLFSWDDSEYLLRSIEVSRAIWTGDVHRLGAAMVSIRPPAMTLLGIPWGRMASWGAAGNCFITLAAVISLVAATCLYLLLRIGVKPFFLVVAALCVGASLGPYPHGAQVTPAGEPILYSPHTIATGFMADGLFAWTTLAAVLLIPYESRTSSSSIGGSIVRGILWSSILSLGAMTKLSFLYFVVFIVPLLFVLRLRYSGLRRAVEAFIAFACWSAPSAIYLLVWGRRAFDNAKASSFGSLADAYCRPLLEFLGSTIRESPGLLVSFALIATALVYLLIKKRLALLGPDFLALLIMIGFCIVVLAAPNKQIRMAFPAIVALPFLTGILMSGEGNPIPGRSAALAAILLFCGLFAAAVPTRHRPDRESLSRADAVLAQAAECDAKHVVLATDSPTLNIYLLALDLEFSQSSVSANTLAYQAVSGVPIEQDFHAMSESDMVVFQDPRHINPKFSNQRVPEYERYISRAQSVPIKVGDDLSIYPVHCRP